MDCLRHSAGVKANTALPSKGSRTKGVMAMIQRNTAGKGVELGRSQDRALGDPCQTCAFLYDSADITPSSTRVSLPPPWCCSGLQP